MCERDVQLKFVLLFCWYVDLMLFTWRSLYLISFMICHMKRLKPCYCFWLLFLLLSYEKDEKCLYFFVKKLPFKNLFPVMRNMKKLRRVRLAAGALGEILVYSTLALFAELCFIYHSLRSTYFFFISCMNNSFYHHFYISSADSYSFIFKWKKIK